jgi:hypothetical protein
MEEYVLYYLTSYVLLMLVQNIYYVNRYIFTCLDLFIHQGPTNCEQILVQLYRKKGQSLRETVKVIFNFVLFYFFLVSFQITQLLNFTNYLYLISKLCCMGLYNAKYIVHAYE